MKDLRALGLIWLAMVGGTVLYGVVATVLVVSGTMEGMGLPPFAETILPGIALVTMPAGPLLRRRMVAAIDGNADREAKIAAYQTATIVALAVIEGGGLLVIVLGMLQGSVSWIVAGAGGATVMMLLARPQAAEIGLDG